MRARWLGAAGRTVLMGCVCGARLYLTRRGWLRRGFVICDRCRAVILAGSLEVVDPDEVEEFMAGLIRNEEEREGLLADVEAELRRFVQVFDSQPEWLWSPVTVQLVRAVRPKLELLGGPIERGASVPVLAPEAAYQGRGEADLLDDEEDAA